MSFNYGSCPSITLLFTLCSMDWSGFQVPTNDHSAILSCYLLTAAGAGAVSLMNSLPRCSEMGELPNAPLWKPQIKKNDCAELFFHPLRPIFSLCFYLSFTSAANELPVHCLFPVRDNLHSYGTACFFPFLIYHFYSCMASKRKVFTPSV